MSAAVLVSTLVSSTPVNFPLLAVLRKAGTTGEVHPSRKRSFRSRGSYRQVRQREAGYEVGWVGVQLLRGEDLGRDLQRSERGAYRVTNIQILAR